MFNSILGIEHPTVRSNSNKLLIRVGPWKLVCEQTPTPLSNSYRQQCQITINSFQFFMIRKLTDKWYRGFTRGGHFSQPVPLPTPLPPHLLVGAIFFFWIYPSLYHAPVPMAHALLVRSSSSMSHVHAIQLLSLGVLYLQQNLPNSHMLSKHLTILLLYQAQLQ